MKLVTEFPHLDDAEACAATLEAKGIATYVSNRHTNQLLQPFHRANSFAGLWVVVDHQLDDALALLDNPDHVVRDPLPSTDIAKIKASVHSGNLNTVISFLFKMLLAALGFAAAIVLLYRLWPTG